MNIIPRYLLHDALLALEGCRHITSNRLKGKLALFQHKFEFEKLKEEMQHYDECLDGGNESASQQ